MAGVALRMLLFPSGTRSLSPSSVFSTLILSRTVWIHICLMLHIHNATWHFIIIVKNFHYLLWNRGAWCPLNNTFQTFLALCIRRTDHLCDSCALSDTAPDEFSIEPAAGNCDVTVTDCSRGVSLDAFLSRWRWGQWFKEFVKYTNVPGFFKFHFRKNLWIRKLFGKGRHS